MADDKKKLMVLGALGVVILGVGAFQFSSGGSEPPPPAPKKDKAKEEAAAKKKADEKKPAKNPTVANRLPQRDPFKAAQLPGMTPPPPVASIPQPVPSGPVAKVQRIPAPAPLEGGSFNAPELPAVEVAPVKETEGPKATKPVVVKPPEPQFDYTLSGVIVGRHPAAVLSDSKGNQRLIPEGAAVDGTSRVISIERGEVLVRFRGKTIRLTVGGNS
jgi:hypothetical protein